MKICDKDEEAFEKGRPSSEIKAQNASTIIYKFISHGYCSAVKIKPFRYKFTLRADINFRHAGPTMKATGVTAPTNSIYYMDFYCLVLGVSAIMIIATGKLIRLRWLRS